MHQEYQSIIASFFHKSVSITDFDKVAEVFARHSKQEQLNVRS
jgi:hypothetical protein